MFVLDEAKKVLRTCVTKTAGGVSASADVSTSAAVSADTSLDFTRDFLPRPIRAILP